jgi:hypothetical protein
MERSNRVTKEITLLIKLLCKKHRKELPNFVTIWLTKLPSKKQINPLKPSGNNGFFP